MLSDNKISNPAIAMGGVTKAMCICPENGDRSEPLSDEGQHKEKIAAPRDGGRSCVGCRM